VSLRREAVYPYKPVLHRSGQSLQRLIVSADPLNESPLPVVLGLQVVDRDPDSLLSVRLEGHGWAVITTIEQVIKSRLDEPSGVISPDEQQAVDNALRTALDL
jgi:mRNA-degrading endonuclease toxin of MazEF toxin-antitoxin module